MKKSWMLALVVLGCGGEPTPAAAPPTSTATGAPAAPASAPATVVSVAPAPTDAAKPEVLPPKTVPLVTTPSCVLEGAGGLASALELRLHDEPFVHIPDVEWAQVQLAPGRATAVGRTKEMDFAAETDPKQLTVIHKTRTLIDGWLASERLTVREVGAGELTVVPSYPSDLTGVTVPELKVKCADVQLTRPSWVDTRPGTLRYVRSGARGSLRDAPIGKGTPRTIGTFGLAADAPVGSLYVWLLEQRGSEAHVAFRDGNGAAEGWTDTSVLEPVATATKQAAVLSAQAEQMQMQMLAVLTGDPRGTLGASAQPTLPACSHALNVWLRGGDEYFVVATIRAGVAPVVGSSAARNAFAEPIALTGAYTPSSSSPVQSPRPTTFVKPADLKTCGAGAASPDGSFVATRGQGLVAGEPPSAPSTARPAAPPPPPGDATVGGTTASVPIANADRVVAGLRPRLRACYNKGLDAAPDAAGKVSFAAEVAPNGEVNAVKVTADKSLPAAATACMKRVIQNAQFDAPGKPSTLTIPVTFAKRKP